MRCFFIIGNCIPDNEKNIMYYIKLHLCTLEVEKNYAERSEAFMYYILENDKPNFIESVLSIVKLKQNKIILPLTEEKLPTKKVQKLLRKTTKIIAQSNSNKVVLSQKVKRQQDYVIGLQNEKIDVVSGQWLFEMLTVDVLDYIVKKKKWNKKEMGVSILINDVTEVRIQIIKQLAKEYKNITIITNHREHFKNIENEFLEKDGIMLAITNNKKKSLLHSKLVLNMDFPRELLNQYQIYEEAIVVNLAGKTEITKKRFNGVVIQDYEITVKRMDELDVEIEKKVLHKDWYEAQFYKKQPYEMVRKQIKRDGVKIDVLYSKNGQFE